MAAVTNPPPTRRPGLAGRLLAAQVVVLVIGIAAAAVTATAVAPALFHEHLMRAGQHVTDAERDHVEEAFTSAGLLSLGAALVAALIAALAASWYIGRRIRRPLQTLTEAASAVRAGHYDVAVPTGGAAELDTLAAGFNDMAARLGRVEQTRRRLLTDLAHELRTPIATLDGYLEGLEDGVVDWTPQTLALLRLQTSRLTRLADDLREVSRAEEGVITLDRTPCDLAELLQDAASSARESFARKGVRLEVAPPRGTVSIEVDRQRMGQVLTNLLANAVRHTSAGGVVRLTGSTGPHGVRVSVADSGEGIEAEHLSHVFDRFYRADPGSGTGVGLTISRALVEAHGGSITAASAGAGQGATFTITLPDRAGRPLIAS